MPRLYLLDGTALAFRSYFALQRSGLSTPEGKPSGATYGFTMTLRKLLEEEKPDKIAVAFDPPGDTFRHEMYGEYKATRQKMPDELVSQAEPIRECVRAHVRSSRSGLEVTTSSTLATLGAAGMDIRIVMATRTSCSRQRQVQLHNVFKGGDQAVIEGLRP
jgi:5'-3' exonuclease